MKMIRTFCAILVVGLISSTPLDDYVNRPDPYYNYIILGSYKEPGCTLYSVNMTSQKWKTDNITDHPIWWHYMSIAVPDNIIYRTGFLFIDGGSNNGGGPPGPQEDTVALISMTAVSSGAVGAVIQQIPNQPIVFKADPSKKRRSEDSIIAWTWKTFIENPDDPEILLRMPMTKAAVRALDTITDVAQKLRGVVVDTFMVAGASKRGWTTWTTAAVDKRVTLIAPIVMDLLNMVKNLHHHYRAYGGWTFAFNSYYELNFTDQLDNPNTQTIADIVDPISYNSRLTIPKLVISTGGDEFFLPDDSHYYYDQLSHPTYLRIIPNAEHSCAGHEISMFFTMRAFFLSVVNKKQLPVFRWVRQLTDTGGRISVFADPEPLTIRTYYAKTVSKVRRDFRLLIASPDNPTKPYPQPVIWHAKNAQRLGKNSFQAEFDSPAEGWLAFFIQVTFQGVDKDTVLEFTTETQIIPDTFPFPDCNGATCFGKLV